MLNTMRADTACIALLALVHDLMPRVAVIGSARAGDAVAMTERGRSAFIRPHEQRMDELVTHPMFGYRISYRVLEVRVRPRARYIAGEARKLDETFKSTTFKQ